MASDHDPLVAGMRLKLKKNWTPTESRRTNSRYSTSLLKDNNKVEELSISLSNRFQLQQDQPGEETVDQTWQGVKGAVMTACTEVLGPKTRQQRQWVTLETLQCIEEKKGRKLQSTTVALECKRMSKVKALEHTQARREVKRRIKTWNLWHQ